MGSFGESSGDLDRSIKARHQNTSYSLQRSLETNKKKQGSKEANKRSSNDGFPQVREPSRFGDGYRGYALLWCRESTRHHHWGVASVAEPKQRNKDDDSRRRRGRRGRSQGRNSHIHCENPRMEEGSDGEGRSLQGDSF